MSYFFFELGRYVASSLNLEGCLASSLDLEGCLASSLYLEGCLVSTLDLKGCLTLASSLIWRDVFHTHWSGGKSYIFF